MNAPSRSDELLLEHQHDIHVRTDRLFAGLMVLQWIGAIVTALVISPRVWAGAQTGIHAHVYAAVFLGGIIVSLPIGLVVTLRGAKITRHVIAVAQMLMSALLIHLTGGRIETHFHVFGSLAFLAFYRDWRVLLTASFVVALDHFLRGEFWPQSVYGIFAASNWRWLEHVWWVCFEDVFLFMAIHQSNQEMRAIAERQARSELARTDAEQASRVKDEFLATLSHELRTPLTSAFGWMAIIRRGAESDRELRGRGLTIIDQNIRALSRLIDDLLDVSRIYSGKFTLDARPMLLGPVIETALESIRPAMDAKQIVLEAKLPETDLVVDGDSGRLQQVVWNLLSNAVKFTPKGGKVQLSLTEKDDVAILKVSDNGIGFPAEFQERIFERFRQVDSSTTRRYGGLGLGLSIVRHVVELHDGRVVASSPGTGKGAEFTVTLPSYKKQSLFVNSNVPRNIRSGLLDGLTVLVVEDEADARALIAVVLEKSGARVLTADSALSALEIFEREKPDVMISDIGMPDEDGYSLIKKVREREATLGRKRRMPAAALTAYAKQEDRSAALAAGFEDHATKPIEPDRLAKLVAELANRRSDS
jgi:signal transduction histidine kinase/CheY-like chemotaxis protein